MHTSSATRSRPRAGDPSSLSGRPTSRPFDRLPPPPPAAGGPWPRALHRPTTPLAPRARRPGQHARPGRPARSGAGAALKPDLVSSTDGGGARRPDYSRPRIGAHITDELALLQVSGGGDLAAVKPAAGRRAGPRPPVAAADSLNESANDRAVGGGTAVGRTSPTQFVPAGK